MIGTLVGGIAASPWARVALRYGTIALAILRFLSCSFVKIFARCEGPAPALTPEFS